MEETGHLENIWYEIRTYTSESVTGVVLDS